MPRRKATKPGPKTRAPRGQVGPQTYDHVRRVAEQKGIPLVKAFEEVAQATGRKAGTIAVTYYRIARRQRGGSGAGSGAAARTGTGRRRGRPPGSGTSAAPVAKVILARVTAAIAELEAVVAKQAEEIKRLRGESALAARIRKALQG